MPEARRFAAVDLGATSGRVVTGRLQDGRVVLEEAHRFPNRPLQLPDGLHWNLPQLFSEALHGLRAAGRVDGVGVDTWGVDYGLLDAGGRLLGLPYHYRDARTAAIVERAFARVGQPELYAATGIQTMPINTVFQLLADEGSAALAAAERLALIPDLLAYWLSGELANECTNASTTGLLDARTGDWAHELIGRLGLPARLFASLVPPGTSLGPLLAHHDLGAPTVFTVASHDTASAFAAVPLRDAHSAVLSSGTWSLLGVELSEPVLTEAAAEANLSNERGVDGTTRLLKNVMGMWLLEECRRAWAAEGHDVTYETVIRLAGEVRGDAPVFDPDDESFLAPGDMPDRIAAACARSGQAPPREVAAIVRSIVVSLACKYRWVLERLEAVSGQVLRRIHVIGGGARNAPLCQLTADLTGREVVAGPVEATALGNLLIQARAAGEIGTLADQRAVAAASADLVAYEPSADAAAEAMYRRFLDVSGLRAPTTA